MHQYKYNRVIFLSTENTIVSPMAESLFRSIAIVSEVECFSRGLIVLFQEPINPKAITVLNNHGLEMIPQSSYQFDTKELDEHTLILTMTNVQKLMAIQDYDICDNIFTLKEYVEEEGDCIDPYGGTLLSYEDCYEELSRLVKKVAYRLTQEYSN